MENNFFAFAPNGGYFCNFHQKWKWKDLDLKIHTQIKNANIARVVWAAFGPGKDNVFFAWVNSAGVVEYFTGEDTPVLLKDWLKGYSLSDQKIKVTLGPEGSFFAWDSTRIRWHAIPAGLEKSIQGWLGPTGWRAGPPRIVTLGCQGSYFTLTEGGSWSYNVCEDLVKTAEEMKGFKEKKVKGEFKFSELAYVNFSSCSADEFLWVKKGLACKGNLGPRFTTDDVEDVYLSVIASQKDQKWAKEYKEKILKKREARRKKEQEDTEKKEEKEKEKEKKEKERRETEEAKARKAEEAKAKAREEEAAKRQKEENDEDMAMQYLLWRSAWEDDLTRKKMLTIFPHLPVRVCTCAELSCTIRKADTGLLACEHDLERLLRASGLYGLAWLRKERLPWHPDRFGQRCNMDFRRDLTRKATEMYALFGVLIDRETEGSGTDG